MTLNYVTLVLDGYDATSTLITGGSVSIAPNVVVTAPADEEWIPQAPVTVAFPLYGGPPSVKLVATDNEDTSPSGWEYTISFGSVAGNPAGFSFLLPYASGATQYLSSIAPSVSPPDLTTVMPYPTGTPVTGDVPVWTGPGQASAWQAQDVVSVFGRTGAVVAETGDYTAAQVGALPGSDDLSAIAAANPTAGDVAMNSYKLTGLADGSAATDSVAFGQVLTLQATTGAAGFTLTDGTPTILSWTAPDDGNLHPVAVFCVVVVTSAETGGAGSVSYTTGGTLGGTGGINGDLATGAHAEGAAQLVVDPGSAVSLAQTSALTAGAAKVYAEIWGA